jgi:hypothetical protein
MLQCYVGINFTFVMVMVGRSGDRNAMVCTGIHTSVYSVQWIDAMFRVSFWFRTK